MFRLRPPAPVPNSNASGQVEARSVLAGWLPAWTWYATPPPQSGDSSTRPQPLSLSAEERETLADEIKDALADTVENNTLLRRDTVFGQFNFTIVTGTVKLYSVGDVEQEGNAKKLMMELNFCNVKLGYESRPRTSSHKISVAVGAVSLYDHCSPDSVFPVLISPQNSEEAPSGKPTRTLPPGLARLLPQSPSSSLPPPSSPLFHLVYEFRPFHSACDYRLHIESQSLDVVYNPVATRWLIDFFTKPHQTRDDDLREAARQGYATMKYKTKQRLLRNWDHIAHGNMSNKKVWDLEFNISAPQIFLVEHFNDKNAVICVVDFGKLHFSNKKNAVDVLSSSSNVMSGGDSFDDEDDEAFQTPCSTPPGSQFGDSPPLSYSRVNSSSFLGGGSGAEPPPASVAGGLGLNDRALLDRLYDRYVMELNDLQILVGKVRDNWKFAQSKGSSALHVLDRFNISLQIDRRIMYTTDPQFPSLSISGNLPKLTVHVNESKIVSLRTMLTVVTESSLGSPLRDENLASNPEPSECESSRRDHEIEEAIDDALEESKLVILQFTIDNMELEVQSRGRSVAELQVQGVKAAYTQRSHMTCLSLSVHSLLLVDALQTFGPDFELLLASHKHVGMDSVSGSLRDSEPCSPTSPGSPDPSLQRRNNTSPIALTQALHSLSVQEYCARAVSPINIASPPLITPSFVKPPLDGQHSEALISVEIIFIEDNSSGGVSSQSNLNSGGDPGGKRENLQIATIQFNNLDVIANQETIVELMGFTKRVFPPMKSKRSHRPYFKESHSSDLHECREDAPAPPPSKNKPPPAHSGGEPRPPPITSTRTELAFDFHRLNVLLLRAVAKDGVIVAKKIATATMSEAKVQATVGEELVVQGSLGGLQVLDLTPEGQTHQRILSLGQDPLVEQTQQSNQNTPRDLFTSLSADLYRMAGYGPAASKPAAPAPIDSQAFSFSITRPLKEDVIEDFAHVHIRLASVWYTHSARFLLELGSCAKEFNQYLTNLARSIGNAATEMAIGLVQTRAESLAQSLSMNGRMSRYGSLSDVSSTPRKSHNRRFSWSQSVEQLDTNYTCGCNTPRENTAANINIRLDLVMDSPVCVLPRNSTSHQVFVAHLGRISLSKDNILSDPLGGNLGDQWLLDDTASSIIKQKYSLEIRDMNLYSLNTKLRTNVTNQSEYELLRIDKLYSCLDGGKPVLHDTVIQLSIERHTIPSLMHQSQDDLSCDLDDVATGYTSSERQENFQITGSVVTPLRVSLSRQQYEQLLDTIDTLFNHTATPDSTEEEPNSSATSLLTSRLGDIQEEDGDGLVTVSPLDLDPALRARMLSAAQANKKKEEEEARVVRMWKVSFELPNFVMELKADLGEGEQGLVELSLGDLIVQYDKSHVYETNIQMSLRSLIMEDLLREPDSKHRCIVVSNISSDPPLLAQPPTFLSTSCPDVSAPVHVSQITLKPGLTNSLPDHLETETVFGATHVKKSVLNEKSKERRENTRYGGSYRPPPEFCPQTPPPSPREKMSPNMFREDNLVHINVLLYNSTPPRSNVNRSIAVDFNSLDIVVNVESWVVVLDFFGISGADVPDTSEPSACETPVLAYPSSDEMGDKCYMNLDKETIIFQTEWDINVKSLSLVLNKTEYEVARANVSALQCRMTGANYANLGPVVTLQGTIGSLSLSDLTPEFSSLYPQRFISSDLKLFVQRFSDRDRRRSRLYDTYLKLDLPCVIYTHTQRFVAELQAFLRHFQQLQKLLGVIRSSSQWVEDHGPGMRLLLEIHAASPIILVPVSSNYDQLLIADLGQLVVKNTFKPCNAQGTISTINSAHEGPDCLLDVIHVNLMHVDLSMGKRYAMAFDSPTSTGAFLTMNNYCIEKQGPALLSEKCQLNLQVERNLMSHFSKKVPDMSIKGVLSKLAASVDLAQYKLLRALLTYNIGEGLDEIHAYANEYYYTYPSEQPGSGNTWTVTSTHLDLMDVSVTLQHSHDSGDALACINFVKSKLTIESYSDRSQDIDLASQEILITDIRYQNEPVNKRSNVFTNILQPMNAANDNVQAEIHYRKRSDLNKLTVLLNNMRLMAILDWWEIVQNFILDNLVLPTIPSISLNPAAPHHVTPTQEQLPFHMKLNVTDSEFVILEDTSQWDTNAVILKMTTVIDYKPNDPHKTLCLNLNHCEMFSCILGMEDETALSIIDPVTVNLELCAAERDPTKMLRIHIAELNIRLSYHDMKMFQQMLTSLPKQTLAAVSDTRNKPANIQNCIRQLSSMGFSDNDCSNALEKCNGDLEEAALWLTRNALTSTSHTQSTEFSFQQSPLNFQEAECYINNLSLCIIDDCKDSDVPLLEFVFRNLNFFRNMVHDRGSCASTLSIDYYNRVLSGWEPFIEPWEGKFSWENKTVSDRRSRVFKVTSLQSLNLNITSTFIDLYSVVKENWMSDYLSPHQTGKDRDSEPIKQLASPSGYRRRSPFVPFALYNNTGCVIKYCTLLTTTDNLSELNRNRRSSVEQSEDWIIVMPNETFPFSFNEQTKRRHLNTHKLCAHQLSVRVEGWKAVDPVTVDKVGVYFRHAEPQNPASGLSHARLVFEVTLDGTAKKLVTVRSSLLIHNKLKQPVEVKLEKPAQAREPTKNISIPVGACQPMPLTYTDAQLFIRPLEKSKQPPSQYFAFCIRPIYWHKIKTPGEMEEETRTCQSNRGQFFSYRFRAAIKRDKFPCDKAEALWMQPAHTISLLSPILLVNLLPINLGYSFNDCVHGIVNKGQDEALYQIDVDAPIGVLLSLDNFDVPGGFTIAPGTTNAVFPVKIQDSNHRKLYLNAQVTYKVGTELKIIVSAHYWILNKTALPLVFRQEGFVTEAAGQFAEHEVARMVEPLLFSFNRHDAPSTLVSRIGQSYQSHSTPQWCQQLHLVPGIQVRKLKVLLKNQRPEELIFVIGIDIRPGRGRYSNTTIVTLTSHYQIHNKSSHKLEFSQKCFATDISNPTAQSTFLQAMPDSSFAFHWPRLDKDQMLCVRMLDQPTCLWSGGFKVNKTDANSSFHIILRDTRGGTYFLRCEIVLQRATYFIVFTDANTMPPPIRIDNFSKVLLQFYQASITSSVKQSTIRPNCTIPYAWDEPDKPHILTVVAPGNVSENYDLNKRGAGPGLTYENFIYIAFSGTFSNVDSDSYDPLDVQTQQLVLDVVDSSGQVLLNRKEPGKRSQLWRMSTEGQLQHEGSSPPRDRKTSSSKIMVLDISGPAPQPEHHVGLCLKRPDPRRASTQKWHFTEDGRLCCAHKKMYVQAKDGFFGLRAGNEAVLGPPQRVSHQATPNGIPIETAVCRQKLRPGSGFLSLNVTSDGPTCVLKICDIKEINSYIIAEGKEWNALQNKPSRILRDDQDQSSTSSQYELSVHLPHGMGISLVSRSPPEELLFAQLTEILLDVHRVRNRESIHLSVKDIQIDNELFGALCPTVLYACPNPKTLDPNELNMPCIQISCDRDLPSSGDSMNVEIIQSLQIKVKPLSLILEEKLFLKVIAFTDYCIEQEKAAENTNDESEIQRILTEVTSIHARRYYFGKLQLSLKQVKLSVVTSAMLPPDLRVIKKRLNLKLLRFEDASIDLEQFSREHLFETCQFILNGVLKHYKNILKWQAYNILGSVDFLGNPVGLMNDLSDGVSGLFLEGSPMSLVKNVTHGLSNSAAKVTESLSDGLGKVILDEQHEEARQKIRQCHNGSGSDHLMAGLKGLGLGILGGVTSVFRQTYEGASTEGMPGFISGFGKGLVGTVTKPVVGVLDFASETASAVRDSSRSSNRLVPHRVRPPRCVVGPTGLMPVYSKRQAVGQEFLYMMNENNYADLFMAYEVLMSGDEDLRIVISSDMLRIFTTSSGSPTTIFKHSLGDVYHCACRSKQLMSGSVQFYIELTVRLPQTAYSMDDEANIKRPRVICDNEAVASWITQQINYARNIYQERQHTLISEE
uniref:Vacuolar protein sorting-associated protein 13D n=1 Tax=Cacopsylla melanoneura TaxID=428564 RepID=A0A8D8VB54_9HEMI